MCGVVGLVARRAIAAKAIEEATWALRHRGPDDGGSWISPDGGVLLGHRRLSIVDLSAAGHQPMESADGRFVIVFNGEIYNHQDIRRELEATGAAPAWRGHSDTETLLAAITAWGLKESLQRSAGMFALALWDKASQRLSLARDRFGEKPLYYGWCASGFAFASELKAIRALPGFDNPVSPAAVRLLLGYGCVPAPLTIHEGLFKLEPGVMLTVPATIAHEASRTPLSQAKPAGVVYEPFYDYLQVVIDGAGSPYPDAKTGRDALRSALAGAVGRQLVADVPVGAFLSGGIDSSLIAAFAARATDKLKTFSIGFEDAAYDEAPYARAVAKHLGSEHHELYVSSADALAVVPMLPTMYDEPFADSSQLPTFLVSRFAREKVTVALTGDAGDELFGGYNRHMELPRLWRRLGAAPAAVRASLLGALSALPPQTWNLGNTLLTGRRRPDFFGAKISRLLRLSARSRSFSDLAGSFLDNWSEEDTGGGQTGLFEASREARYRALAALPLESQIMAADALAYLPDAILVKVDRAAMAVSLEGRIPFLDPEVAAVAARIPVSEKFSGGSGKQVLRELLYEMAPRELFERPKAGFAMPVGPWLRGPLRDWAQDLLSESSLAASGLLVVKPVRRRWQEHLSGRTDHSETLWAVLMLQSWLREQNAGGSGALSEIAQAAA